MATIDWQEYHRLMALSPSDFKTQKASFEKTIARMDRTIFERARAPLS